MDGNNGAQSGKNDSKNDDKDGGQDGGRIDRKSDPRRGLKTITVDPVEGLEPLADFPASERVFLHESVEGNDTISGDIRVPVRRIHVGGGEPPLDVYDTFGPRAVDPHQGLPKLRQPWIDRRIARGDLNFSQMHYARLGEITEEMRFVALREGFPRRLSVTRWRVGARLFPRTASTPNPNR